LAVTAKFQADFKSFYDAVEKAEVELRGLETGAAKVEKSLNKMADSFSGRKLIQDANLAAKAIEDIGGASMLTAKEQAKVNAQVTEALAKYKALGIEAPASLQKLAKETAGVGTEMTKTSGGISGLVGSLGKMAGALGIAFSAGAVISFGKQVLASAGQIDDLSKKLGVSAESVQRWKFAAEQGGATIENVDKAVTVMNRSLAEGDKSTIGALKSAGLSFDKIRMMKPEDAFNAITKAIGEIPDPMERARVAVELFGKGGAELLPAIVDGFADVAAGADVMSNETVKRLADAEDAWGRLGTKVTIVSGEILAATMDVVGRASSSWSSFFKLLGAGLPGGLGQQFAVDFATDGLMPDGSATPAKPGMSETDRKKAITDAIEKAKADSDAAAAAKKAEKAADDYADALKRLREVIPPLTAEQRKSVEAWLAQGKATKDMATVLRVNEKAVTDFKKEQEDLDKILEKGIGSVLGLGDSYKQLGQQIKLTDGIVSTWMVSMRDVDDFLGDLAKVGTKMPMPELPPPPDASAWEEHFLGLSAASAEAARVNGEVWMLSFQKAGMHLGNLSRHFDGVMGDILSMAAETADALSTMFNPMSSSLDKVMAGIDLAISLGKKLVGLFKDEAHEATNDIRDDFLATFGPGGTGITSGFGILAGKLAEIEGGSAAFKALLDAKTPEAFAVAMARVNTILGSTPAALAAAAGFQTKAQLEAMAAEAVKVHAYMRDSGLFTAAAVQEAWERANAALVKAGDEAATAAGKAEDALAGLKAELKGLEDSVANEAWEEEMGVIEREQRARIDAIKAEMEAREAQIAEETAAREDAAQQAADDLKRILAETEFVARLKFEYELPEGLTVGAGSGLPGFAGGTKGQYLDFGAGTLAMLHGKERVVTEAEGRAAAVGNRPIHVTVMTPDYRVLGEGIAREYQQ
jgi:hypothetical protein